MATAGSSTDRHGRTIVVGDRVTFTTESFNATFAAGQPPEGTIVGFLLSDDPRLDIVIVGLRYIPRADVVLVR